MNGTYTPDMTMGKECGNKFLKNLYQMLHTFCVLPCVAQSVRIDFRGNIRNKVLNFQK